MTALNPITQLRLQRAKSKRAPMPVSQKPRRKHADSQSRINFYTEAGKLLYGRLIAAVTGIRFDYTMDIMLERDARNTIQSKRRRSNGSWKPAANGSRECARRVRQGAHLNQHPSVIARFADHPTQADITRAVAEAEAAGGKPSLVKRAMKTMGLIPGETEVERHNRLQAARRDALTLETA